MSRPDEGLIHTWLDGELDAEESARVERLVATDPEWAAAAAEARGLIAASSRILGKLDVVAGDVIPQGGSAAPAFKQADVIPMAPVRTNAPRRVPTWLRVAASFVLVAGVAYVAVPRNEPTGESAVATGVAFEKAPPPSAAPAPTSVPSTVPPTTAAPSTQGIIDGPRRAEQTVASGAGAIAVEPADRAAVQRQAQEAELAREERARAAANDATTRVSALQERAVALQDSIASQRRDAQRDVAAGAAPAPSVGRALASRDSGADRRVAANADQPVSQPAAKAVAKAPFPAVAPSVPTTNAPAAQAAPAPVEASGAAAALQERSTAGRLDLARQSPVQGFATTGRQLTGCWRVTTTARVDSIQRSPAIVSTAGDTLVIVLDPVSFTARVRRVGEDRLEGTVRNAVARGGAMTPVPFVAEKMACEP